MHIVSFSCKVVEERFEFIAQLQI